MDKRSELTRRAMALFVSASMALGGVPSYAFADDGTTRSGAPLLEETAGSMVEYANQQFVDAEDDAQVVDDVEELSDGSEQNQPEGQNQPEDALEVADESVGAIEAEVSESAVGQVGLPEDADSLELTDATHEGATNLAAQSQSVSNFGLGQSIDSWVFGGSVGNIHRFSLQNITHIKLNFSCSEQDADLITVYLRGRYCDTITGSSLICTRTIDYSKYRESMRSIDRCLSAGSYEVEVVRRGDASQSSHYVLSLSGTQLSSSSNPYYYGDLASLSVHGYNTYYPIGQGVSIALGKTYEDAKTADMPKNVIYDVDIPKAGDYTLTVACKCCAIANSGRLQVGFGYGSGAGGNFFGADYYGGAKTLSKTFRVADAGRYHLWLNTVGGGDYEAAWEGQYSFRLSAVPAKESNPITAKANKATVSTTYSASKSRTTAKNVSVSNAQGTVTYTNASTSVVAKGFTVNKSTGKVTIPKRTKVGTYTIKIKATAAGNSSYKSGSKTVTYKIKVKKAANTLTIKGSTKTTTVAAVKSKAKTFSKCVTVSKKVGSLTYAKASGSKRLTVNKKTGKVTVRKGTKKGTYKIKIKVTAAGNKNYKKASKFAIVTVKVTA